MADEKKTPAKVLPGPGPKVVDLNAPPKLIPNVPPVVLSGDQFARLQHALLVAGAISGLLAAGRIPNTPENKRYLDAAIAAGLERL